MSDYNEYEEYEEDNFLDYLRNLFVSPRTLGEEIKERPAVLWFSLIVFCLAIVSFAVSGKPIVTSFFMSIGIYLSVVLTATVIFGMNKFLTGNMTYKEALSVWLCVQFIYLIGTILGALLSGFSVISFFVRMIIFLWDIYIAVVLIDETSYLGINYSIMIVVITTILMAVLGFLLMASMASSVMDITQVQ